MVEISECGRTGSKLVRISPDCSMSGPALALVFAAAAAGSLMFSGLLAFQGFWIPLPFAGAEVLALGLALLWVRRELRRSERIDIGPRGVRVQRGASTTDFNPAWMRVELRQGRFRCHPRRLVLTCHGREMEVGHFLHEDERARLAQRLAELLRPYSAWAA